ncbi:hypothetical protein [Cognataquiflexum nitidum]|nr:hypothetical protein [Cognataquiflexum nitidum]
MKNSRKAPCSRSTWQNLIPYHTAKLPETFTIDELKKGLPIT